MFSHVASERPHSSAALWAQRVWDAPESRLADLRPNPLSVGRGGQRKLVGPGHWVLQGRASGFACSLLLHTCLAPTPDSDTQTDRQTHMSSQHTDLSALPCVPSEPNHVPRPGQRPTFMPPTSQPPRSTPVLPVSFWGRNRAHTHTV